MEHKHTNALINSTSPYLLQHAHNPVNWQSWSEEIIDQAKAENKLILVSIGYAACHWCHVMEHESFEDEQVAAVMNENFICIKVDREERPDVDHFYMTAVQLMRQQGGWPLNVIAMPDGRPVWGGTYFPKEMWLKNILAVADFKRQNPVQIEQYAKDLQNGIRQVSLIEPKDEVPVNADLPERAVNKWKSKFDLHKGGRQGQPKFPMPVNHEFLLYYGFISKDKTVLDFVKITLEQMARGGIYDQVGGGFARYSVDDKWKVPHFEKMLYDNGQLISLYSKGFQHFGQKEFKSVVYETVEFIARELTDETGAFYSSLDADSEGEEGRFYVWESSELKRVLKEDYELFAEYFNVNSTGFWEKGNYILLRNQTDMEFADARKMVPEEFQEKVKLWKQKLLIERANRVRPGLDDKTLASWNALVLQGLADAYMAFHDEYFLDLAKRNAQFLKENMIWEDGKMFHNWKKGKSSVDGFLEDYALVIQSFLSLFETTGEEIWIKDAVKLLSYAFENFFDEESGLFYYTEKTGSGVLTNHFQNEDNVMPAANSVMANNLYKLYLILGEPRYKNYVKNMLKLVASDFAGYPMAYSNWGTLILKMAAPFYEIAVCGADAKKRVQQLQYGYQPNILWAYSEGNSNLPVLKDRFVKGKTLIYVCEEGVCQLPVEKVSEAIELMNNDTMKKVEFFIIGNGLAGTMLAFEMWKNNIDFRIISAPGKSRASEVAAGMINPLVFKRLTKSWLVDDLLPVAKKTYHNLENLLNERFYFEKKILKPLSAQEKELWLERKQNPEFSSYIFSVDDYSPVKNVIPAAGFGQVHSSGYVALSSFLNLADNFFRTKNLIIDATFNVQQMKPETDFFEAEGVKASKVIFCEGAHIRNNPLFRWVKMVPVKGEVLMIHAPSLSGELILNKKVFVLPVGNQRFKVGSTYDWNDLSDKTTESGKLLIIERLENVITCDYTIENQWAGIRPATADRRPVLGVHPLYRNLFVFNGLGTKGVMLAPYFTEEMLSLVMQNNFEVHTEVKVERFF